MNINKSIKTTMSLLTLASISAISLSTASAALIASYNDGIAEDALALTDLISNPSVTVSSLANVGFSGGTKITRPSFGSNTLAGPTAGSAAGSEWLHMLSLRTGTIPVSTADYFGFTVTAVGSDTLSLNSLAFDFVAVANSAGSILSNGSAQVFINVDGGGFNSIGSAVTSSATQTGSGSVWGTVGTGNIDLSSITGANSVEIRIGIGDTSTVPGGTATFAQGIRLDADIISVPEPSTTALLGLGGLALILRRRK